jgi:superfamily II DNA or RNA helicase
MSKLFSFVPPLGLDQINMRSYQADAVRSTRDAIKKGYRAPLIVHATGLGKTVIIAKIARMVADKDGRTLVIAHRDELITQTANTLERAGITAGIEKASAKARHGMDPQVVVASVQTLQKKRLESWPKDHFKMIICDEAHHATASSYRKIKNHFHTAIFAGVTATPDRVDGESLMGVFDIVAHEFSIIDGMTAEAPGPYLARLTYVQIKIDIDLRSLKMDKKKDFSNDDLAERISPKIGLLANSIQQEAGDRPTIIFMPDVASASAMSNALESMGLASTWVSGECPDRSEKVARYQRKDVQYIVNFGVLTEGFDAAHTACVVPLRPTKSRALFMQMLGRGTRLGKPDCRVLDFNYLTDEHDLVRPADLFINDGGASEVRKLTHELLAKGKGLDVLDITNAAKKIHAEKEAARREVEIRTRQRTIAYESRTEFDPLTAQRQTPSAFLRTIAHEAPTPKMVSFLKWKGHANPERYSRSYAGKLIGLYKSAENQSQPES